MKNLKILALAALVAFAACDEEEGPITEVPVTPGTVVVTVNGGGAAVAGITVTLGAAGSTPQSTNASGQATFASVPIGNYVVSISGVPVDFVCPSTTQPVTVASNQTTSVRFDCNLVQTASVSGTVTNTTGTPRAGVNIVITRTLPAPAAAAVTVTTDAAGRYSLTGLRSGTYTVNLGVTTGCTTAASTQTVVIAAGEARSVNFQCTVVTPPPTGAQASGSINSITFTGPFGQISNVPDNEVQGSVTVNATINEGDQKVTKVDLLLCNDAQTVCTVVGTQSYTQAASPAEKAVFPISFAVNTMAFNTTTGVPNFLNTAAGGPSRFVLRIYTVAGGSTTPAATVSRAIVLVNIDAFYGRITSERTALSTETSALGAGFLFHNGDITLTALPIMYSGLTLQNMTLMFSADVPSGSNTNLDTYMAGGFTNRTQTRTDAAAPFTLPLPSGNGIADDDCTTDLDDCGSGGVEDVAPLVGVTSLRSDGQPGPGTGLLVLAVCTDGSIVNIILFPFSQGCANGQFPAAFRIDNRAPTIDQVDRLLRTLTQFAYPPRTGAVVCVGQFDASLAGSSPTDKSTNCNGVTGWLGNAHTFTVTRLLAGSTPTVANAIAPRVADLGVGLPATGYFAVHVGNAVPTSGTTAAAAYGSIVTSTAGQAATVDNQANYINVWVWDVFGLAGETSNQLVRWNNDTPTGTGTSSGNITALIASMVSRFGINDMAPCFTQDGLTCADRWLGELNANGQIIGTAGSATIAPGGSIGGVRDGGSLVSQVLSMSNSAGGSPAFPIYPVIFRVRRLAPSAAGLSTATQCFVGFTSGSSCQFAGEATGTTNGKYSGIYGCYDFLVTIVGPSAAHPGCAAQPAGNAADFSVRDLFFGTNVDVAKTFSTGACPSATSFAGCGDGYYVIERRAVDNAFLKSALSTITLVHDRTAPLALGGVSHSVTVAPGGLVTITTAGQDFLELWYTDYYQLFGGTTHAIRRARIMHGTFGPSSFDTGPLAISATFDWYSNLQVGPGADVAATNNASGGLFRIHDFGMNVAHQPQGSFPVLSSARVAGEAIGSTALWVTNQVVCWNTGVGTCGNPTSTTLIFQVTGPVATPFVRVEFAVARDANNDGVPDTDGAGNTLWHIIGNAQLSVVGTTYTYSRSVTGSDLGLTASRSRNFQPIGPANNVIIRAFGVRANGSVVTLTNAALGNCPTTSPGVDSSCIMNIPGS